MHLVRLDPGARLPAGERVVVEPGWGASASSTPSRIALGVVVLVLAGGAVAIVVNAASESESEPARRRPEAGRPRRRGRRASGQFAENALREVAKEGIEKRAAVFEPQGEEPSSGEAERGGPTSPAAQAVADRAYPRAYVDDQRAEKTLQGLQAASRRASRIARRRSGASLQAAATASWKELGPFTPERGRRGLAVLRSRHADGARDAGDGPGDLDGDRPRLRARRLPAGGRRRRAAACGHTDDALADHVQWQAPPNDLPTTAFGSIYYDAANDVLYAGSGEPNGSSDSEAGLGPVQVDRLRQLVVAGSRAARRWRRTARSAAIAVDPNDPDTIYIGTALARHGSSSVNGGRRTPPDAPTLGVYRSTDGGRQLPARAGPLRQGAAGPDAAGHRGRLLRRRGLEAAHRPEPPGPAVRGGVRLRAVAGQPVGRRPDLAAGLPHDEPERLHRSERVHRRLDRGRDRVRLRRPRREDEDLRRRRVRRLGASTATMRPRRRGRGATTTRTRSWAIPTGTCRRATRWATTSIRRRGGPSSRAPMRPTPGSASTTTARTASAATTAWSPTRRARGRGRSGTWAR